MDWEKRQEFLDRFGLTESKSRNEITRKLWEPRCHFSPTKDGVRNWSFIQEFIDNDAFDHTRMLYNKEHKCYIVMSYPYIEWESIIEYTYELCYLKNLEIINLEDYSFYDTGTTLFAIGTKENITSKS